ncbi:MAG: hypothetical protein JW908_10335 [Anaerolineales bacterium]|nr:hypothetical protein [Anaerolineales bacterium]
MHNQWNVREEILLATHRWPLILLFILVGSLIGLIISCLLPHYYRAETNLHVSYNADAIFRNPDDYKNWNMEQLNVIVLSDNTLRNTLERLAAADPYWGDITTEQLTPRLQVHWRSVGIWRLVAEDHQPDRAEALAQAWKAAVLEEITIALENARLAQQYNDQFFATARAKVDASLRASTLSEAATALSGWRQSTAQSDPDQVLDNTNRWRLLSLVAQVADSNEAGQLLMNQMPAEGDSIAMYHTWVDNALVYIDTELPIVEKHLADLAPQAEMYYVKWGEKNHIAYGLSMYLTVEDVEQVKPVAKAVRLDSIAALVGGCLGLIVWCFIWLMRPAIKENR